MSLLFPTKPYHFVGFVGAPLFPSGTFHPFLLHAETLFSCRRRVTTSYACSFLPKPQKLRLLRCGSAVNVCQSRSTLFALLERFDIPFQGTQWALLPKLKFGQRSIFPASGQSPLRSTLFTQSFARSLALPLSHSVFSPSGTLWEPFF